MADVLEYRILQRRKKVCLQGGIDGPSLPRLDSDMLPTVDLKVIATEAYVAALAELVYAQIGKSGMYNTVR